MALTSKQKEDNKKRVALRIIHNGVKMDFSMHKIETWNHLHLKLGLPPVTTDSPITFPELKSFLDNQTKELEDKLNGQATIGISQQAEKQSTDSIGTTTNIESPIARELRTVVAKDERPISGLSIIAKGETPISISQSIPTPLSQPIQQSPAPTKS